MLTSANSFLQKIFINKFSLTKIFKWEIQVNRRTYEIPKNERHKLLKLDFCKFFIEHQTLSEHFLRFIRSKVVPPKIKKKIGRKHFNFTKTTNTLIPQRQFFNLFISIL